MGEMVTGARRHADKRHVELDGDGRNQPQRPIAAGNTDRVGASSHRLARQRHRVVAGGELMDADTADAGAVHEADPAGGAIAGAGIDQQPRSGRRRGRALPWGGRPGVGERLPGGQPIGKRCDHDGEHTGGLPQAEGDEVDH
jgi:hypothetical protein